MGAIRPAVEFLIVDEQCAISGFLAQYLQERDHTCVALRESATARWLESNRCEVALVDLPTLSESGLTVVATIRHRKTNIPVIGLSRHAWADAQVDAAMCAGANGYVCRALPAEHLYPVLLRTLATARLQARRTCSRRELLRAS